MLNIADIKDAFNAPRHSLVKMLDGNELDGPPPLRRASTIESPTSIIHHSGAKLTRRASLDDLEQESCQLTPKIDHRIVVITNEEVRFALSLRKKLKFWTEHVNFKFDFSV